MVPGLLIKAIYRLFDDSGLSLASAVAFSFLLSVFPFFVFLGSMIGHFGWADQLRDVIVQLLVVLPQDVENIMIPEINTIIRGDRLDLLTLSGLVTLFFASSGIEALRGAFNRAYRDHEKRRILHRRVQSIFFVFESAAVMLLVSSVLLFAPQISRFLSPITANFIANELVLEYLTYGAAVLVMIFQLFIYHMWLPAGYRPLAKIAPGVAVSVFLWLLCASLFSIYVNLSDFGELYGRLAGVVIALTFFYFTSVLIILGAQYNRAKIVTMKEAENPSE